MSERRTHGPFTCDPYYEKRRQTTMLLNGQILTGSTQTIATKKGDHLQKTRLKILDLGQEANGGDLFWGGFPRRRTPTSGAWRHDSPQTRQAHGRPNEPAWCEAARLPR